MILQNGQIVKLQPMRFENIVTIMQSIHNADTAEQMISRQLIESVAFMIVSVDEIDDREMVHEWLTQIPTTWFSDISKAIESISDWGPDFKYTTKCKDCGQEVDLSVVLNPLTFFM